VSQASQATQATQATAANPTEARTILVVDDDAALRDTLAYNLRSEGYRVLTAADGVAALETARQSVPDLVLLDLMLPRLDGLEVCRRLRASAETAKVPILMLTARGEETDKVVGLELGADDYVTKPFSWNEVRARVRALLRRSEQAAIAGAATREAAGDEARVLTAGDLRIDLDRREASRGERQIELPARLFDLLVYMVRNHGTVLTRDRLLQNVWDYEYSGDTRTVDVHIRWLREKLEDDPANPQLIQTVRGVGYRFKG
jgi:DNA-binding response OmpR family regulator